MKLALSTNWCSRRLERGAEIVDAAIRLGFESLELGFHATDVQVREILEDGRLPVGSVHAFCPVPISAPQGYPELYQLASFDEETRAMARFQVRKNISFAASVGAGALVLHAGRIARKGWFRERRSRKLTEIFQAELARLTPELEKGRVVLGIENMPYSEGFPNDEEMRAIAGEWVRPWYDTGHGFVIKCQPENPVGMHINDSLGGDDHLPPGEGKVDFAGLLPMIRQSKHLVFEPGENVCEERLVAGLAKFRSIIGQ